MNLERRAGAVFGVIDNEQSSGGPLPVVGRRIAFLGARTSAS
jgi:hypothetical protein